MNGFIMHPCPSCGKETKILHGIYPNTCTHCSAKLSTNMSFSLKIVAEALNSTIIHWAIVKMDGSDTSSVEEVLVVSGPDDGTYSVILARSNKYFYPSEDLAIGENLFTSKASALAGFKKMIISELSSFDVELKECQSQQDDIKKQKAILQKELKKTRKAML